MMQEWGSSCPEHVCAYRLEKDMSWTPLDKLDKRTSEEEVIDKILKAGSKLQLTFD